MSPAPCSDVLIVGAGGSGLASAIFLSSILPNAKISVLCKTYAMGSHTTSAKGGINAALGNIHHDKVAWHVHDTISASKNLSDTTPTQKMCEEAPNILNFLNNIGVEFDRTPSGKIDQRIYGGQTTDFGHGHFANRACFVKDHTGHAIMKSLVAKANETPTITIHNYTQALKLITEGTTHHVITYNIAKGKLETHSASHVIFATGGFSQIYKTNSSSHLYTGCGHRILFENGAKLKDIELIQFHPTGIHGSGILISEACRSQGAYLVNAKGERFMEKYHPLKELAPRDIISNAIHAQLQNGKVYLDLRHIPQTEIQSKLISSYNVAKHFAKVDLAKEPISIAPTAHYNMGGVAVDENYHIGNNIYAIGELACASVHGANRLGCNSLLELFTSAKFATQKIAESFKPLTLSTLPQSVTNAIAHLQNGTNNTSIEEILQIKACIQEIMEKHASIIKTQKGLQTALKEITTIHAHLNSLNNFKNIIFDDSFIALFETQSLALMAKCVLKSALFRQHSIGAHQRKDFPLPPEKPQHTIIDQYLTVTYSEVL